MMRERLSMTADQEPKRRGRPPKPTEERKSGNLTFRTRGDLRAKLDAAATASGRSVSEEIERRLERSFDHDEMVSSVIETIEENSRLQIQIIELQAEVERLKSTGPETSDLEIIVERAVVRAVGRVLSSKGQEPEQPQSATELPDRERSILEFLIAGASNREIAQKLGIPVEALKAEIGAILKKIKVANQAQAITWARQHLMPADFMHEARQYQAPPKTAGKARIPAKTKA
jgi:DNA-binding NarL/FixJ family response regulator